MSSYTRITSVNLMLKTKIIQAIGRIKRESFTRNNTNRRSGIKREKIYPNGR